jgi:hypothetical protein
MCHLAHWNSVECGGIPQPLVVLLVVDIPENTGDAGNGREKKWHL